MILLVKVFHLIYDNEKQETEVTFSFTLTHKVRILDITKLYRNAERLKK